jgi:hypothetical protein
VAGGTMTLRVTGPDPFVLGPPMRVPAAEYGTLVLGIRAPQGGEGQVFWTRIGQPGTSEGLSQRFQVAPGDDWREVRVALGDHPEWTGTITRLRFDPPGAAGDRVEIDYLRLE